MQPSEIPAILEQAVRLQQQRKLSEAAAIYERVLSIAPQQPDALHLLGLIRMDTGDFAAACKLLQAATSVAPESSVMWGNYGVVLKRAGQIDDALAAYQRAIELAPKEPETRFNYGKALQAKGRVADAQTQFKSALAIKPTYAAPWVSLMNMALRDGQAEQALQFGLQAAKQLPQSLPILKSLGTIYKRLRDLPKALECFARAVELDPKDCEAQCKIAGVYISQRDYQAARERLEMARPLGSESQEFLNVLGLYLHSVSENSQAVQVLAKAIERFPDNSTAHANLGIAYKKLGRLSDARQALLKAIELDPNSFDTIINLAGVELSLGMLHSAQERFRLVIEARNGDKDAHDSLLMCLQYDPQVSANQLFQEHAAWSERYAKPEDFDWATAKAQATAKADHPIRVGFCSADLGRHPVGYFLYKLFQGVDPKKIETHVYSDRVGDDLLTDELRTLVTSWIDTVAWTDAQLLEKLRHDQLDMLFDLSGHTAHNRLLVFARRAAPIQISWAGYVGTTGLQQIDYLLGDRYHLPEEWNNGCELPLRMPSGYVTYTPSIEAPPVGPCPALANGFVTFIAACNPAKVNPTILAVWKQVLTRVPNSRLRLCYTGWPDSANIARVADVLGSVADRVECEERDGVDGVFQAYGEADLALDTFPYSGGLTTCEALWMGVPTITLPSDRFAGRHSLSHLSNVGLGEFVADSFDDYVERAVAVASDLERLNALRLSLRERMRASPLCDGDKFCRDFEKMLDELQSRSSRFAADPARS